MSGLGFMAVGLGAALGAWSRWLLGILLNPMLVMLPLGTLAANLIGGYLVGVAVGVFHINSGLSPALKLLVITGFLGGLTTFSTFSAEVVERLLAHQVGWALALACTHLVGSLLMTYLGLITVGADKIFS
ncbi:MAG: fluoride exporter [Pseudomonadota bacterium]|nr:fluoride exporter [Pseudomonadota bacterium]MDQ5919032.1 fluoride exporter [Pseudomonadota bacterium]MDQ5942792.1 fluoride exporter [Pseudomonadota bacterium]MDQ5947158.1 fluoride exporter [Pseudomonadota bacterium]